MLTSPTTAARSRGEVKLSQSADPLLLSQEGAPSGGGAVLLWVSRIAEASVFF